GNLDIALLGVGRGIAGEGIVAKALFRMKAAGDPKIGISRAEARNAENQPVPFGSRPVGGEGALPSQTAIGTIGPNPFAIQTSIQLSLSHDGAVKLAVYDVTGREVKRLVNGAMQA